MWLSLFLIFASSAITYGNPELSDCGDIKRTQVLPMDVVRFNNLACADHNMSRAFCEDSGWGDGEATVVCRNEMYSKYGFGGYANVVHDREVGFSYINCTGDEGGLEECSVGNLTSHNCTKAGIIHCFNNSQVVVSVSDQVRVFENEAIEFCVILWAPQPWQVDVLVSTNDSGLALAGYDYHPLKQIVSFEPSNATRLEQCLQIEIIDDSLAEYWEQFTVQLSTNNSAVNLTHHKFDVYIRPSDNITMCTEGSVTVVSDANNSSLQLVEMCSSEGVWSPVCDYDWTAEDVTVVCRELGFPDSESIRHATLNKTAAITGTSVECEGNEETIKECSTTQAEMDIRCTLVLVDCVVEDSDEETNNNDSGNSPNSSIASGTIAGVLVAVILVLLLVVILVIIFVILRRKTKQISVPSDQQYDSANARFQRSMEGVGEKHLDNPVYDSGKGLETFLQSGENFEHNLMNPLYSINTESTDSKPHDYATLESDAAEYEIPRCDTLPKNEAHPSTNAANYDYVDI